MDANSKFHIFSFDGEPLLEDFDLGYGRARFYNEDIQGCRRFKKDNACRVLHRNGEYRLSHCIKYDHD